MNDLQNALIDAGCEPVSINHEAATLSYTVDDFGIAPVVIKLDKKANSVTFEGGVPDDPYLMDRVLHLIRRTR